MNASQTQILSRRILLAFLAIIIILAIAAIIVRDTISEKLAHLSNLANIEHNEARPQQILMLLHHAEDDFQASLIEVNGSKTESYKTNLAKAFGKIDTLLKETANTSSLTSAQNKKVLIWQDKKLKLSGRLSSLKHNFDSLLTVYADFNALASKEPERIIQVYTRKRVIEVKTDTVKKEVEVKKKGFFSRLKSAISNDGTAAGPGSVIEINRNQTNNQSEFTAQTIMNKDREAYLKKIKQLQRLQKRNTNIMSMQRELIILNSHITVELTQIINDVKEINFKAAQEFKDIAFKSYQDSTALLNKLYIIALLLVVLFAGMLIIFIIKLNKSDKLLRIENTRAVNMAQQKMDLLLHMSHEIRNPLTAIKGFLYIFSQTTLTTRQSEMLDSIRLSSDMLLGTLNDTLDAAKMENSEFKINSDPFNPDFTLKSVIESMEFSASKKELGISYEFTGNKEAVLLGDSFRLKQVMINLLSNAIKYTEKGFIKVKAEIVTIDKKQRLKVDVIDTGAGISEEQQENLFSKYYQTSSSKGITGTGLGLYIVKEFIKLQKGEIGVKSVAGKGSTFSFYIPYEDGAVATTYKHEGQSTEELLSLLNGQHILAVDDNELNLKFLEMMTRKWNIKFFSAINGREALEVINKEKITVVFTDIHMPEMDGNELLAAIRKLKSPVSELPVIMMSGDTQTSGKPSFSKTGFNGVVSKPFIESELVEQIVGVLNL